MTKNLFFIACITFLACSSQKNVPGPATSTVVTQDSVTVEKSGEGETKAATPTKTIILNNTDTAVKKVAEKPKAPTTRPEAKADKLPECLQKLVKQFMAEDVQNPPRKIYSYTYHGNLVYYVTAPCCDFFSDLYDSQCKLIAHPDGGITGRGDGRAKDFTETKSQEKLVWEDVRKYR